MSKEIGPKERAQREMQERRFSHRYTPNIVKRPTLDAAIKDKIAAIKPGRKGAKRK